MLVVGAEIFVFYLNFFLDSNFKSLQFYVFVREKDKEKMRGGGLKPTLLVGKNVTTQIPSNNTSINISSNLRFLWQ
jgi:hypothetical protein